MKQSNYLSDEQHQPEMVIFTEEEDAFEQEMREEENHVEQNQDEDEEVEDPTQLYNHHVEGSSGNQQEHLQEAGEQIGSTGHHPVHIERSAFEEESDNEVQEASFQPIVNNRWVYLSPMNINMPRVKETFSSDGEPEQGPSEVMEQYVERVSIIEHTAMLDEDDVSYIPPHQHLVEENIPYQLFFELENAVQIVEQE